MAGQFRECIHVEEVEQHAVDAVLDHLANRPRIRGQDRRPAGERVQQRPREHERDRQVDMHIGDIENIRVDKQVGGGSSNAGSTSLVSKGAAPSILGFAVENGALTQNISGTTVTYRGNLVGTIEALNKLNLPAGVDIKIKASQR